MWRLIETDLNRAKCGKPMFVRVCVCVCVCVPLSVIGDERSAGQTISIGFTTLTSNIKGFIGQKKTYFLENTYFS